MLDIGRISKRFGTRQALAEVSFAVRPGEGFGFVGSNGAGKTTTMRIVLGVLAADSGEVRWKGSPIDADLAHRFENPGPGDAVLLAVVSAGLRRS